VVPLSHKDRKDQFNCIDFTKPVVSGPPPPPPTQLGQWQAPGASRGSYFAPQGTPPTKLGIGDTGTAWTLPGEPVLSKEERVHKIHPTSPYLQSTAAPANDTWSVPGMVQPAKGGGSQYFIPTGCDPDCTSIQP
jgi:hypothetical protein